MAPRPTPSGLKVEDAAATVQRARMLGAEPFAERRGPGELAIPAIRGVGGGVIYFLDSRSELSRGLGHRVRPRPGSQPASGAGLTRIDHVAQTMNYEEMLTWVLFYVSIFRTRKMPMVDVVDPGGLVRSQAIEMRGRPSPDPERRGEPQDAGRALHRRELRLSDAAFGVRNREYLRDAVAGMVALRLPAAAKSLRTTMTTSRLGSGWIPT